jgi:hypothetical protein
MSKPTLVERLRYADIPKQNNDIHLLMIEAADRIDELEEALKTISNKDKLKGMSLRAFASDALARNRGESDG